MFLFYILIISNLTKAETFTYKNGLSVEATSYKEASRLCFQQLTGGKYQGEEKGLDIIDVCVNPIKGEMK